MSEDIKALVSAEAGSNSPVIEEQKVVGTIGQSLKLRIVGGPQVVDGDSVRTEISEHFRRFVVQDGDPAPPQDLRSGESLLHLCYRCGLLAEKLSQHPVTKAPGHLGRTGKPFRYRTYFTISDLSLAAYLALHAQTGQAEEASEEVGRPD
jgi:hypothetical protein